MHSISVRRALLKDTFSEIQCKKKKKVKISWRKFVFMFHDSIYYCCICQRVSNVRKKEIVLGICKDHDP